MGSTFSLKRVKNNKEEVASLTTYNVRDIMMYNEVICDILKLNNAIPESKRELLVDVTSEMENIKKLAELDVLCKEVDVINEIENITFRTILLEADSCELLPQYIRNDEDLESNKKVWVEIFKALKEGYMFLVIK